MSNIYGPANSHLAQAPEVGFGREPASGDVGRSGAAAGPDDAILAVLHVLQSDMPLGVVESALLRAGKLFFEDMVQACDERLTRKQPSASLAADPQEKPKPARPPRKSGSA